MHYSGILVVADSGRIDRCRATLAALPGLEVHHVDQPTGRLIVVQELDSVEAQQDGLRAIQALPDVRLAALVEHRVDRQPLSRREETDDE